MIGDLILQATSITSLYMPELTKIEQLYLLNLNTGTLAFPKLRQVTQGFLISSSQALTTMLFPELEAAIGEITMRCQGVCIMLEKGKFYYIY